MNASGSSVSLGSWSFLSLPHGSFRALHISAENLIYLLFIVLFIVLFNFMILHHNFILTISWDFKREFGISILVSFEQLIEWSTEILWIFFKMPNIMLSKNHCAWKYNLVRAVSHNKTRLKNYILISWAFSIFFHLKFFGLDYLADWDFGKNYVAKFIYCVFVFH